MLTFENYYAPLYYTETTPNVYYVIDDNEPACRGRGCGSQLCNQRKARLNYQQQLALAVEREEQLRRHKFQQYQRQMVQRQQAIKRKEEEARKREYLRQREEYLRQVERAKAEEAQRHQEALQQEILKQYFAKLRLQEQQEKEKQAQRQKTQVKSRQLVTKEDASRYVVIFRDVSQKAVDVNFVRDDNQLVIKVEGALRGGYRTYNTTTVDFEEEVDYRNINGQMINGDLVLALPKMQREDVQTKNLVTEKEQEVETNNSEANDSENDEKETASESEESVWEDYLESNTSGVESSERADSIRNAEEESQPIIDEPEEKPQEKDSKKPTLKSIPVKKVTKPQKKDHKRKSAHKHKDHKKHKTAKPVAEKVGSASSSEPASPNVKPIKVRHVVLEELEDPDISS